MKAVLPGESLTPPPAHQPQLTAPLCTPPVKLQPDFIQMW